MFDPCIDIVMEMAGISKNEAGEILDQVRIKKDRLFAEGKLDSADRKLKELTRDQGDRMKLTAALQRKHAALNILKRKRLEGQIDVFLKESDGDYKEAILSVLVGSHGRVATARKSITARRQAIVGEWIFGINAEISKFNRAILGRLRKDRAFQEDIVREMYENRPHGNPGRTGDKDAAFMAGLFGKYAEISRVRLNESGAFIGKLEGWSPQGHDPARLLKAGKDTWLAGVLPRLDIERSFPGLNEIEVRDILSEVYENIVTGRDRGITAVQKGDYVGPRNLAKSLEKHRVLHFKTADHWLEYQKSYGMGNVFTAMLSHLQWSARNTSIMEVLGPNPETMLGALLESQRHNIRVDKTVTADAKIKALSALNTDIAKRTGPIGQSFSEVMGETLIPHNLTAARIGSGIRAVQSMAKLGMATISSFNDVLTYSMALRFQGRNMFESYSDAFKTLLSGRPSPEQREIVNMLGATYDGILDDIANRWHAQDSLPGRMSEILDKFFRLSGLTWWTNRLKAGFARTTSTFMAGLAPMHWYDLSEAYRHTLGLHGIDRSRWQVIRHLVTTEADGRKYVLPDSVDGLDDRIIDRLISDEISGAKKTLKVGQSSRSDVNIERKKRFDKRVDRLRRETRKDLKTDLMAFYADEMNYAVLEPDDRTRRLMLLGSAPGTIEGETMRFIAQFKSFPIAYSQRILSGRRWRMEGKGPDPAGIANIIAGTLVFGYAAMSAKDFLKGKAPRDPRKWETWIAAAVQGGGAGIYGDFLFGKYDRFGGGAVETAAGPTAGSVGRLIEMFSGSLRGETDAGDAFYFAMNNTPFVNLWYGRAALDYGITYHIQEMLSPGTLRRRQRRLKKEFGQKYILPPSGVIRRGGGFR